MKTNHGVKEELTIVGGGPVGTLLALHLAKKGYSVDVFEKRGDPRSHMEPEGRSINLALSTRGLCALNEVGVNKQLLPHAVQMKGRLVHDKDARQHFIPYSPRADRLIYSITRMELNKVLLDEAAMNSNIRFHYNENCLGIDLKAQTILFQNMRSKLMHKRPLSITFGAEGMWSAIRTSLLRVPYTNFSQQHLDYDYKELTIPASQGHLLEKNALHLWPRGGHLMVALPNPDGSFTCTLFLPHEGERSFAHLKQQDAAVAFFQREFSDALPLMKDFFRQMIEYPVGRLTTVKIDPWSFQNKILLIGDAAHGIVPFYGQGLNCGFENCAFLSRCIDEHAGKWDLIFHAYEQGRRANTDAIAELSFDNFVELRERVSDPLFKLKSKLEGALEAAYPEEFLSKYSMVTFSCMPYTEALVKGRRQDQLLMEICKHITNVEEVDLQALKSKLSNSV